MKFVVLTDEHLFSAPRPDSAIPGSLVEVGRDVDELAGSVPEWVSVELADGSKGFLPRASLRAVGLGVIVEDVFFVELRLAALDEASRTDHHYLYALAFAESGAQNIPSTILGSDAVGPFQYSTARWAELLAKFGAASGITADDRTDWGQQARMAAFEASDQAAKAAPLAGRTAQYDELYLMHLLGDAGGGAVVGAAATDSTKPIQNVLAAAGLAKAAIDAFFVPHPDPAKNKAGALGTLADALDAATDALQEGFERAAQLAARLDPPELHPTVVPADAPAANPAEFALPAASAGSVAKHKAEAERVLAALAGTEWKKPQVIGIIANIFKESGFNEKIPGDGGHAYGLCQWHEDRQKNFFNHFHRSIQGSSFEDQVKFIDVELQSSEHIAAEHLRAQTTAGAAGYIVSLYYERPAGGKTTANARAGVAEAFAALLGG